MQPKPGLVQSRRLLVHRSLGDPTAQGNATSPPRLRFSEAGILRLRSRHDSNRSVATETAKRGHQAGPPPAHRNSGSPFGGKSCCLRISHHLPGYDLEGTARCVLEFAIVAIATRL